MHANYFCASLRHRRFLRTKGSRCRKKFHSRRCLRGSSCHILLSFTSFHAIFSPVTSFTHAGGRSFVACSMITVRIGFTYPRVACSTTVVSIASTFTGSTRAMSRAVFRALMVIFLWARTFCRNLRGLHGTDFYMSRSSTKNHNRSGGKLTSTSTINFYGFCSCFHWLQWSCIDITIRAFIWHSDKNIACNICRAWLTVDQCS